MILIVNVLPAVATQSWCGWVYIERQAVTVDDIYKLHIVTIPAPP